MSFCSYNKPIFRLQSLRSYFNRETNIKSGSTKSIHLAFPFGLELEAKMLRQVKFAFEGNTLDISFTLCLLPLMGHNVQIKIDVKFMWRHKIIFLSIPNFSNFLQQSIRKLLYQLFTNISTANIHILKFIPYCECFEYLQYQTKNKFKL